LTAEIKRAQLSGSSVGGFTTISTGKLSTLLDMCSQSGGLASDADIVGSSSTVMNKFPRYQMLVYSVSAYRPDSGAAVVHQARTFAKTCTTYIEGNSYHENRHVVTTDALPTPTGAADAYAFCDAETVVKPNNQAGQKFVSCTAVLGRGHLVVEVTTGNALAATAREQLPYFIRAAGKALVTAVPDAGN
jgi:hypothetical protein